VQIQILWCLVVIFVFVVAIFFSTVESKVMDLGLSGNNLWESERSYSSLKSISLSSIPFFSEQIANVVE